MEPKSTFLRACLRLPVERTPIWLMRQAGRYLPEYRDIRSEAGDFLNLCYNPKLATEVTLQPLRRFPLDAAILFSDILVIPQAMGMSLKFSVGEGPIFSNPIRTIKDIEELEVPNPEEKLAPVLEIVTQLRKILGETPLIGFSGSPWTLATYMVEGGSSKKFHQIKAMMYNNPMLLNQILDILVISVAKYLNAQIRHGAQAVQIFDTWGGVLAPEQFREFSLKPVAEIIKRLDRIGPDKVRVPVIFFAKGCGYMLEEMAEIGCDVLGLDWTTNLAKAHQRVGHRVALQGNLDPSVLYASPEVIQREVFELLNSYPSPTGHIFNLGHGLEPDMDPERVSILVEAVHQASSLKGKSIK
ncbi:MAG: uroporphyrinogen decarboxylase [Magnetococcus sp. DMHC-6]